MNKTILTTALLLAACPVFLPAQAQKPVQVAGGPGISIEFAGGSLRELIDAMHRIDPRLNITAAAMARDVKLPDLSIKGATVMDVLNAAAMIAPRDYIVECRNTEITGGSEPVYTVMVDKRPRNGPPPEKNEREVRVFSLAALTEPMPVDRKEKAIALPVSSVLSALEAGVGLVGGPAAELKYHGESKLLFVSGLPDQINVVREVLQNLQKDQSEMRQALFTERRRADEDAQRAKGEPKGFEGKMDKK
jgi:hypothetical protein